MGANRSSVSILGSVPLLLPPPFPFIHPHHIAYQNVSCARHAIKLHIHTGGGRGRMDLIGGG